MSDELEGMLSNLDDAVKRVSVNDKGGFEIPDGEYLMMINTAEIKKAQKTSRIHVQMDCTILDGEYASMPLRSYDLRFTDSEGVPDMRSIGYFKLACHRLGLGHPDGMEESRDAVSNMNNRVFIGRIKNNGDFVNMMVIRFVHDDYMQWVASGSPVEQSPVANNRNTGW